MQRDITDKTRDDVFSSNDNTSGSLPYSSGPSLEEKLFSSCDLTTDKKAQVNFKPCQAMSELAPRTRVSVHFQSSSKARNWAQCSDDLSAAFTLEKTPEPPAASPAPTAAQAQPHQASSACGESRAVSVPHICPSNSTPISLQLCSVFLALLIIKCFCKLCWRIHFPTRRFSYYLQSPVRANGLIYTQHVSTFPTNRMLSSRILGKE